MQLNRNDQQDEFLTVIQLTKEADFQSKEISLFDCGDKDLNEFLKDDALYYKKHLLAETYLCFPTELFKQGNTKPIAYISLCNDSIPMTAKQRKAELKRFFKQCIQKTLPNKKRYHSSFPAVKIARLGVHKDYHSGGVGTHLLNMIKSLFLINNRTGCKILTVDAYNNDRTIAFYAKKNQFDFLWDKDKNEEQRIMWFDLSYHHPSLNDLPKNSAKLDL